MYSKNSRLNIADSRMTSAHRGSAHSEFPTSFQHNPLNIYNNSCSHIAQPTNPGTPVLGMQTFPNILKFIFKKKTHTQCVSMYGLSGQQFNIDV